MSWLYLLVLAVLVQYLYFAVRVAQARGRLGVQAPAVTGPAEFECRYRVQQNTLELLAVFLPALWLAAQLMPTLWVSGVGALFPLGRALYAWGYLQQPPRRRLPGFALSMTAVVALLCLALVGLLRQL